LIEIVVPVLLGIRSGFQNCGPGLVLGEFSRWACVMSSAACDLILIFLLS